MSIQVLITNISGFSFPLLIKRTESVNRLKQIVTLHEKINYETDTYLTCNGKLLQDENNLEYYNIQNDDVIRLHLRLRGGSSPNKIELLRLFKDNLIKFFDAIIEQFPKETDFILIRVLISDQIPVQDIMKTFSFRITPYIDMIKNKDQRFFIESSNLFDGLSNSKVSHFKNIWLSSSLTDDDREQLWKWFKLFANIVVKYNNEC